MRSRSAPAGQRRPGESRSTAAGVQATVAEPHDPPLTGAEHDRAPRRGESYVKDFKPLKMGVMELKSGRGTWSCGRSRCPGKSVMDVRAVSLRLLE